MKLLLDEMYWPALAEQLVARGHDVIAANAHAHLSGIPDDEVFAAAQLGDMAVNGRRVALRRCIPIDQLVAHCRTGQPSAVP